MTTQPPPSNPSPGPAASPTDPATAALIAMGIPPEAIAAALSGSGAVSSGPLWGNDLITALTQTSMSVAGRYGQTGSDLTVRLPPWARSLPQEVTSSPDWDPYLGIVSQAGDERVFMGGTSSYKVEVPGTPPNKFAAEFDPASIPTETETRQAPQTLTVTQAMNMPYTWDEDEVNDAIKKFRAAGIDIDSFDLGEGSLVAMWGTMVNRAAMMFSLSEGKKEVTPWDVLDLYKKEADAAGIGPFTGSKTTVKRNVTDITEGQAFAALQSTLSELLGRDPSDQEARDYAYRVNHLAATNPAIQRTVTEYKNGRAVSSSSHTDPGFTADDLAMEAYERAQDDPDYAEYRSASYLFNAAMSALGPIGGQ